MQKGANQLLRYKKRIKEKLFSFMDDGMIGGF